LAFPSNRLQEAIAESNMVKMIIQITQKKIESLIFNPTEYPIKSRVVKIAHRISEEGRSGINTNEAYQIYMAVKKTEKISGALAEVGVSRGGSARIICEAKGKRPLHLFDTFEGLPDVEQIDSCKYSRGLYSASLKDVTEYLQEYPNVYIYKGLFPASSTPIQNERFAFVNLDVDLRKSTYDCLEFFYPRMNKAGIIISHDYVHSPGVMKAFDDFFTDKPEPVIEVAGLYGSQALVIKF